LVAACLAGDSASWDALIARYQGFIYALALRMGLSAPDADDVFQNVCLSLFQHLGELRDANRLSSWLATMVKQEVWRLGRRRKAL
jgi:RNA polymerase sigma factor (sigma-70 family)